MDGNKAEAKPSADLEDAIAESKVESVRDANPKLGKALKISHVNAAIVIASIILVALAIVITLNLIQVSRESNDVYARYKACSDANTELMEASDYLTTQARLFVTSGNRQFMDNYFNELLVTKRRDKAVSVLESQTGNEKAKENLEEALNESNELARSEEYAMRLVAEAEGMDDLPQILADVELKPGDEALGPDGKRERATSLVIGESYDAMKSNIYHGVEKSSMGLISMLDSELLEIERNTGDFLTGLVVVGILVLISVIVGGIAVYQLVTRPMRIHAVSISEGKHLESIGCDEIRRVVDAYNDVYDRAQQRTENLKREAEMDALTNLLNRGSYNRIIAGQEDEFALVLADIDHFKDINDTYGHEMGDAVIQAVAEAIASQFRSSDFVCRLGGDEFAMILPNFTPDHSSVIEWKLHEINERTKSMPEDMPAVTLSFGVAFSDGGSESIYNNADSALYESKRAGRNQVTFYSNSESITSSA